MPAVEHRHDGLSIKEAAKEIGVHEQTIRNWIRDGVLAVTRFPYGSSPSRLVREIIRVHPDDLAAVAASRDRGRYSGGEDPSGQSESRD